MARWEPNTRERLVRAALDLYTEHGYDATTIGAIADSVGVTSRTYFRYFPDKREVLFANPELHAAIVAGAAAALDSRPPFHAVLAGIVGSEPVFQERAFVRRRAAVIATSEELRERELTKGAALAADLRAAMVEHGAVEPVARMAADAGVLVFTEATRRWADDDRTPFADLVRHAAHELEAAIVAM